jgi:hypothetical protein
VLEQRLAHPVVLRAILRHCSRHTPRLGLGRLGPAAPPSAGSCYYGAGRDT